MVYAQRRLNLARDAGAMNKKRVSPPTGDCNSRRAGTHASAELFSGFLGRKNGNIHPYFEMERLGAAELERRLGNYGLGRELRARRLERPLLFREPRPNPLSQSKEQSIRLGSRGDVGAIPAR